MSKLHENAMNDQFREYFVNILNDLLCAYHKNYSCQCVLVKMVGDWKVLLDNNHMIGVIFMDLESFWLLAPWTFYCTASSYGLNEHACDLIASYLSNGHQPVKIQNSRSDWWVLRKGVPQRSILGPLLFNVFVNDMFHFIEKRVLYNYADDNSMSCTSLNARDVLSCLKRDYDNAVKWFEINGMQANPSKFQFMVMSNGSVDKDCISLSVDESILTPESHVKVLGVTLDDRLTFNEHISICCSKAARQLNGLSRLSTQLALRRWPNVNPYIGPTWICQLAQRWSSNVAPTSAQCWHTNVGATLRQWLYANVIPTLAQQPFWFMGCDLNGCMFGCVDQWNISW